MRSSYHNKKSQMFQILEAVQDKTASKAMLENISAEIDDHIRNHPAGTLENFKGAYGEKLIAALRKNYPHLIKDSWLELSCEKILKLKDKIYGMAIDNRKIEVAPAILKMIYEDLDSSEIYENESNTNTIVLTNYPISIGGNYTKPLKKN